MTEYWRELLYPLGFLSALAFSARMLIQWVSSEAKRQSYVMPIFWKLSLTGNLLLALHSFIQIQFHVCVIQMCNAVISWRNLNLMQPPAKQIPLSKTVAILAFAIIGTLSAFLIQNHLMAHAAVGWFRIPNNPWGNPWQQAHQPLSMAWHLFGFIGLALFSSRFWLQWWCAEQRHKSYLGAAFWWVSLTGETICLIYFLHINDPVNFIGPLFALIPYIRNLMLLNRQKKIFIAQD